MRRQAGRGWVRALYRHAKSWYIVLADCASLPLLRAQQSKRHARAEDVTCDKGKCVQTTDDLQYLKRQVKKMNCKSLGLILLAISAGAFGQKVPKMPATYYVRYSGTVKIFGSRPETQKEVVEMAEKGGVLMNRRAVIAKQSGTIESIYDGKTTFSWSDGKYASITSGPYARPDFLRLPLNPHCKDLLSPYKKISAFEKSQAARFKEPTPNLNELEAYDQGEYLYKPVALQRKKDLVTMSYGKPGSIESRHEYSHFRKLGSAMIPSTIVVTSFNEIWGPKNTVKRIVWLKKTMHLDVASLTVPKDFQVSKHLNAGTLVSYEGPEGRASWKFDPTKSFAEQLKAAHPMLVKSSVPKHKYPLKLAVETSRR